MNITTLYIPLQKDVKASFKEKCKKDDKKMIDMLRIMSREFVNEDSSINYPFFYNDGYENAKFRNFPTRLKKELKTACIDRDVTIKDVMNYKIKKYIGE